MSHTKMATLSTVASILALALVYQLVLGGVDNLIRKWRVRNS